jgi:hypothetical protein
MKKDGWIKLYRKLQDSSIYKNLNSKQRDVLIQCLLMANHQPNKWEWNGEIKECKAGQFITSLSSLKEKCAEDVSIQNIRTALEKLEKWNFIEDQSTRNGRLITVVNWSKYQSGTNKGGSRGDRSYPQKTNKATNKGNNTKTKGKSKGGNKATNKAVTKHQQSGNKAVTTNNNVNNVNNDKNEKNFKKADRKSKRKNPNEKPDGTTGVLRDGTEVVKKFGEWVDKRTGAKIDSQYYPEVAKDNVKKNKEDYD